MDSATLIIKVCDNTNFDFPFKLPENIRELKIVWNDDIKDYNKSSQSYRVKSFLYKVCQNHRNLRVLDLSLLEGLTEAYFDIWWIQEIYLPETVKRVNYSPARSLRKLSALGAEDISVNDAPDLECVIYGDSLKKINLSNTGITKIDIPKNCSFVYAGAFRNCKNLKEIDISNSLDLPPFTFENCERLSKIVLPNHVTKLEQGVFKGCRNLIEIEGGISIKEIAKDAFEGCNNLEKIDLWDYFKKLNKKGIKETSQKYFGDGIVEHIGIVLFDIQNKWIIWSLTKKRYYFTDFCSYRDTENIEENNIVKFTTLENPIMLVESKIYLFRNPSCLKFTDFEVMKSPCDSDLLSMSKQELLFEYFKSRWKIEEEFDTYYNEQLERISKLDIIDIVNTYSVKARTWWQIRPGKDDFECTEYETTSLYSDDYIETLLPLRNGRGHSSGICPIGYYNEKEENEKLQEQVDYETREYKNSALKSYSKESHINFFANKFWNDRKKLEEEVNNIYHIERIKNFAYSLHKLYGREEHIYGLLLNCTYNDIFNKKYILEGPFYKHL